MRAYQLPKGGAGIESVTRVDLPEPKPQHRQVLVKVAACSLNFRDLGIVRGTYRMAVRDKIVPLSDGAGEVVEIGAGVTRVKVGDKVAGCFFQRWPGGEPSQNVQASALGGSIDGMLAEYAVLEEDGVVKIPAHLSLEEGATLALRRGDRVARHDGARQADRRADRAAARHRRRLDLRPAVRPRHGRRPPIITSSSDDKLKRATALGAAHTINYKTTPDWEKAAVAFTGGRGVDQVVEVGGAGTLARSFGAIRIGGKISMIGGLSGAATELNPGLILGRRANVQGISVGSTEMFEAMNAAIAANAIKPVIDKVFGFDEAQAAYQHMASGAHFGKIVIRV